MCICGGAGLREGLRNFRRHIGFIVFSQHFLSKKHPLLVQLATGNDTLPLPKQIRQNALINNSDLRFVHIGDNKIDLQICC